MTAERSNVLAFGPMPVAWLSLPLTQARAAAIVQFEERTGYPIIDVLTRRARRHRFRFRTRTAARGQSGAPCGRAPRGRRERVCE
jgi:hypothetical protein